MKSMPRLAVLSLVVAVLAIICTHAFSGEGDWVTVGGDFGQTKYSPLKQITAANVTKLTQVWSYPAGGREITPIAIAGMLYYPSGTRIIALNGMTGKVAWETDMSKLVPAPVQGATNGARAAGLGMGFGRGRGNQPPADTKYLQLGSSAKYGVSLWPGDSTSVPRLVVATTGGYLIQLLNSE